MFLAAATPCSIATFQCLKKKWDFLNERKYFQGLIDDLHKQFVTAVSKERNLSFSVIDKLATGQVFTGTQAFANGLIDLLGTMEDAVLLAAQNTSREGRPVMVYPPEEKKGLLNVLFGDIFQRLSLANLNLYPQPEYRMIYKIR